MATRSTAGELPEISSLTYSSRTAAPMHFGGRSAHDNMALIAANVWQPERLPQWTLDDLIASPTNSQPEDDYQEEDDDMADAKFSCRLVKVYIADPDEDVPLPRRLLYTGSEQLTDLTDQELYFEIDIKSILDAHNAARQGWENKKLSANRDKPVMLEPIKVRDLKMVVVTLAQF